MAASPSSDEVSVGSSASAVVLACSHTGVVRISPALARFRFAAELRFSGEVNARVARRVGKLAAMQEQRARRLRTALMCTTDARSRPWRHTMRPSLPRRKLALSPLVKGRCFSAFHPSS
jgi:hypothetical protein